MGVSKKVIYSKGASLAVIGSDGSPFWICKTAQDVKEGRKSFQVFWYEEEKAKEWTLSSSSDTVPLASVICQLRLKRVKEKVFTMSDVEFKRTLRIKDSGSRRKTKVSGCKRGKVFSKVKKVKVPRVKVDRSNPNWRLKPRKQVTEYSVDPFFESKSMDFPFISTSHYSRLLFRSILLKDKRLLQSLINDGKRVSNLNIRRSLADNRDPATFAILQGDKKALKMFFSNDIHTKPRAPHPIQLIKTVSTGTYNFKSLGIRRIRKIEVSRGGREGNNALTKNDTESDGKMREFILANVPCKDMLEFLIREYFVYPSYLMSNITEVLYAGHLEAAIYLLKNYSKNYGFTNLHIEALSAKDWSQGTKGMKEASVLKKSERSITPLHLAAMNPNVEIFKSLFSVAPNLWVEDVNKRTPVHYAVASIKGMEVIKFLDSKSVSWELPDKDGYTPLAIATRISNLPAMEFIISKGNKKEDKSLTSKYGVAGIDRPLKNSYRPIHLAAMFGKVESMKVLLKHGVKVEKPLSAREGTFTALMISAAYDHLDIVRLLIERGKAKVEAQDKFKRTALTHAVMNGATRVASYLLRLGANPERCDSSGNSNLHYACAYGWYHCVSLLLESGTLPDPLNEWKLSPCAIAFLRGHRGLGEYMLKIPGVSGNFQDSEGRTLLLHLLKTGSNENSCDDLLSYLIYLLDDLSINPQASDIHNRNAFHYLAEYLDYDLRSEKETEDAKSRKIVLQIFDILYEKGCNPSQMDNSGHFPLDHLLNTNLDQLNHELINKFIDAMSMDISKVKLMKDENISIITYFINNLRLQEMHEMKRIGLKLVDFYKQLELDGLVDMAKYREQNRTLLFKFCQIYSNFPSNSDKKLRNFSECMYRNLWVESRDFLVYFLKNFKPCLRERKNPGEISAHEIMLTATNEPNANEENPTFKAGFEVLFSFDSDLEAVSSDGSTCLVRSILSNNLFQFNQFIAKGANIITTHKESMPFYYEESFKDNDDVFVYRAPLIDSILVGNLEMFVTLMKNGAVCPPQRLPNYPIFIAAVDQVLRNRNDVNRMAMMKAVIESGNFLGSTIVSGYNALHLCVENSTDDFNINLEVESHLLKCGVSPIHRDDFGRIPLHYAFIKDVLGQTSSNKRDFVPGEDNGLTVIDPIEIVSMLVDGMEKTFIDSLDVNGSSPLHYACIRGSTVCAMLLIEKGADINRKDTFGNTPLAYAIMGRHEATAITLLQKDADANCQVFLNSFLYSSPSLAEDIHSKEVFNSNFKFLPAHFMARERSQFPYTLFEISLQNGWLGVSYLILGRMEKHGMRFADAVEVAFKLQKFQLAKKLLLKQINNKRLCELVTNKMNLISSLMKHLPKSQYEDHVIDFIVGHLVRSGNKLQLKDNSGCTSLHYVSLSNIPKLLHLLLSYPEGKDTINKVDKNRRSPLAAILWSCVSTNAVECAKILFSHGADPNIIFHFKKFDYFHKNFHPSTVNYLYDDLLRDPSLSELTTPLIIAVNFRNRPLIDLILDNGADPNMTDGSGRTPLMAAVKSNDVEFVKYFVNASKVSGVRNESSRPPYKKRKNSHLLINVKDNDGFNIMHHALFGNKLWDGAHDNMDMIQFLQSVGGDHLDKSNEMKVNATDIAEKMKLPLVYQLLANKSLPAQDVIHGICSPSDFPYNVQSDAEAMFAILSKKKCSNNEDASIGLSKWFNRTNYKINSLPTGLSLTSGNLVKDYTTLLSKVMVQASHGGVYNFYRMQIWKDDQKDLFVLFTNWGRWGDHGNYQNTPFGSEEQVIQEFKKIYQSKTGNDWSKRTKFHPKMYKYRQLDIASFVKRPRPKINFDLKSEVPSKLPVPIQTSIKHISNVTMYTEAYEDLSIDSHVIPFGHINKSDILNALELLKEIEKLIQEKDTLLNMEDEASKSRLHIVLEEIQNKSNEYFYLMPVREISDTRITPIQDEYSFASELSLATYLLEFEFAERVLLGAQYRKNEINPLDYIYRCLSVQMTPLTPKDKMSDIIMKYIYNGGQTHHSIDAIFKITQNKVGNPSLHKKYPESTPRLLWHGTKCINLLSILDKGLIVDPPYSERCEDTYGKGIYAADVYDESFDYCDQNKSYAYIFLCQVHLGKVYNQLSGNFDDKVAKSYNSIKVSCLYEPLERDDLHLLEGVCAPLGEITRPHNDYRCDSYNEFIVKESSQISTDYLIRIKID